jgi:hypothetical protein
VSEAAVSLPPALLAMTSELGREALLELERALRIVLADKETPAQRRARDLGPLAQLLETHAHGAEKHTRFSRKDYEAAPADSLSSDELIALYGHWTQACRAAAGIRPDGRVKGRGKTWTVSRRGRRRPTTYRREEVHEAIRRCAFEIGRWPSSADYHRWSLEKRRALLATGVPTGPDDEAWSPRIPTMTTVYRFYKRGKNRGDRWARALADAMKPFTSLDGTRTSLPTPVGQHDRIGPRRRRRRRQTDEQHSHSEAFDAAPGDGGDDDDEKNSSMSSDDITETKNPTTQTPRRLNPNATRKARERIGISERSLRNLLGLQLGPYRRLLSGRDEPTLALLEQLADVLAVDPHELVISRNGN